MLNKKDYKTLVNCLETRKRDDGTEYKCRKDGTPEHVEELMQDVMFKNDNTDFDLDYNIMYSALMALYDIDHKDLKDYDVYDNCYGEYASVYTATRLSYLNVWTQDEISSVQKEYGCEDIASACAFWYDDQVKTVIGALQNAIVKYSYE